MTSVEQQHYGRLVGRRIEHLIESGDSDIGNVPGFELDDGTRVWILSVPEGNAPGFLEL